MVSVEESTTWNVEHHQEVGLNVSAGGIEDGPTEWATGLGSAVMLTFFVEAVVGTCWILVALLRVSELRRSVVNVFVRLQTVSDVYDTLSSNFSISV